MRIRIPMRILIGGLIALALAVLFWGVLPSARAAGGTATLTVDLSGTWLRDITVELWPTGAMTPKYVYGNQHGAVRTYSVDSGTYDTVIRQGAQTNKITGVDCATSLTCTATVLTKTLTVDLAALPNTAWLRDITVELYTSATTPTLIWAAGNQHGANRTYNVLSGTYNVVLRQGAQVNDILGVDCGGEGVLTCSATVPKRTLTVDLTGLEETAWLRDITVELYTSATTPTLIWAAGNQHGANRTYTVLAGVYNLKLREGAQVNSLSVDCGAEGALTCSATVPKRTLTVNLSGTWLRDITVELYPQGNTTPIWAAGNQHGANRTYTVLAGKYDLKLREGPQVNSLSVDCGAEGALTCSATVPKRTLTVDLSGTWLRDITVELYTSATTPTLIWAAGNQHGANRTYNVLSGTYDVVLRQGAQTYLVNAINCASDATCNVGDVIAELTLDLSGSWDRDITVRLHQDNATVGSAGTQIWAVGNQHGAKRVYNVLKSKYDVVAAKGNQDYLWDAVDCTGETCATGLSALTVKFPSITSVHTYVRKSDGVAGTAVGQLVSERTYKTDQAEFTGLAYGLYDVVVVKGAQTKIIDNVTVLGGGSILDNLVAKLTVKFDGISGVHTYVKTTGGGAVDERTYKNDTTALMVLRAPYKVTVVKGAQQNTYDVNCSAGDCTLDGIVATLTVNFPNISGVHTYVKTTGGGAVDERTYKTGKAEFVVLKGTYNLLVVKGAQQNTYDGVNAVNCTGTTCSLDNIVATLTVNFPGISGVHTYVKTAASPSGAVDERTYQNSSTTLNVLRANYNVLVVKGAQQKTYPVDCTGATCELKDIVATLTLHFPGKTGVHVYLKMDDAYGGAVDERTYKNGGISLVVLKGSYDLLVNIGGTNYVFDAVNANSSPAIYTLTLIKLLNSSGAGIAGGEVNYYAGSWKSLGTTPASGVLNRAIPGAPTTYSFSMTYAGGRQQKDQNLSAGIEVVFQTRVVTVRLKNNAGNVGALNGTAQYYAGSWREIGPTTNGVVSIELLPLSYSFSMVYAGGRQQFDGVSATQVDFQTRMVTVLLVDSAGNVGALNGTAQYYAGSWREIGPTTNGVVSIELLPLSYSFSMVYAGGRQQFDGVSAIQVVFQTGQVHSESGKATQYYAGEWRTFSNDMQLLPGNYPFHFTDKPQTSYTINAGTVINTIY